MKANGYGLGAREVVKRLQAAGCRHFFVATWAEAKGLMPWPSDLELSVLHGVQARDMFAARKTAARPVLNSPGQVARWKGTGRPCDVMVDTGINRLGLTLEQATGGLLDGLTIETLMSHLACADEDGPANTAQLGAFREIAGKVEAKRYSLANSAGICLGKDYAFDLTRPGLALYGGVPRREAEGQIAVGVRGGGVRAAGSRRGEAGLFGTFTAKRPMEWILTSLMTTDLCAAFRTAAGGGRRRFRARGGRCLICWRWRRQRAGLR